MSRKVWGQSMTSISTSSETARQLALAKARANTAIALADIDPVYCPHCGWMQAEMVQRVKFTHLKGVRLATQIMVPGGASLVGALGIAFNHEDHAGPDLVSLGLGFAGLASLLAGLLLFFYRRRAVRRYDPNALPLEARLALSRTRCLTEDQLRQFQAAHPPPPPRPAAP